MSKFFQLVLVMGLMAGLCVFCGCEASSTDSTSALGVSDLQATSSSDTPSSSSSSSSGSSSFPSGVTWLHADVSGWAQTASLSVSFEGSMINLNYDKAKVWPSQAGANANVWVFVNYGGAWYAGTWEWLRAGQTAKAKSSVNGNHIKVPPLSSWSPHSGEQLGFMVSGLCRDSKRTVSERSNLVWANWP